VRLEVDGTEFEKACWYVRARATALTPVPS
jgi:hypothetical protein